MDKKTAKTYSQIGKEKGSIALPSDIFGQKWNADLVHQVFHSILANKRAGTAHAKDRGEVSGGGKKPWRQKGTGRARHGSTRSPIWVGGGSSHGPNKDKNYNKKINKKMKVKALCSVLSKKFDDGEVIFVEKMEIKDGPKSKEAKEILSALSQVSDFGSILKKRKNSTLVLMAQKDPVLKKSFNNFSNIEIDEVRNLNVVTLLNHKYLIFTEPEKSISFLEERLKSKK